MFRSFVYFIRRSFFLRSFVFSAEVFFSDSFSSLVTVVLVFSVCVCVQCVLAALRSTLSIRIKCMYSDIVVSIKHGDGRR